MRHGAPVLVVAGLALVLAACDPCAPNTGNSTASPTLAALGALPVKGKAPRTGYARAQYGHKYADTDRDGCDTRNNALQRDLQDVRIAPGTHGCLVLSGTLHDPYSGAQAIPYAKGTRSPIDFEHVVALENAWQTGAQLLTPEQREQLANDPLNVLMAGASANRSKRGNDASGWLPPNKSYRCAYVSRQIAVKTRYHLWITPAEHDAMRRILGGCDAATVPTTEQVAFPHS